MAPRHYVYVLLLVLLTSAACAPTAPTPAPAPALPPPVAGLPDGRLVIQEVSARPVVSDDGATVWYEPWVILRETTGQVGVFIQSIVMRPADGRSGIGCIGVTRYQLTR